MANPSFYTLETIAKPGATPQAVRSASSKSFANNYSKLCQPNISQREQEALAIIGLIHTVTSPDYRTNHKGLIQDAQVYNGAISQEFKVWAALAAIDWTNGKLVDAALSTDVPTLLNEARDIAQIDEDTLTGIYTFLRAQLLS